MNYLMDLMIAPNGLLLSSLHGHTSAAGTLGRDKRRIRLNCHGWRSETGRRPPFLHWGNTNPCIAREREQTEDGIYGASYLLRGEGHGRRSASIFVKNKSTSGCASKHDQRAPNATYVVIFRAAYPGADNLSGRASHLYKSCR